MRTLTGAIVAAGALALMAGCGGSSSPTSPSTGGGTSSGAGPSGATITITSSGVSPAQVTITRGQSVTFVNNDTRTHDIASNPHPVHTDCPAMNVVGIISQGQTKVSDAFTTARSCGFHDHNNPSDGSLQGTVVIQ
jgi:plastocyanin